MIRDLWASLRGQCREMWAVLWGLRWSVLCCGLFLSNQREPWPYYSLVQFAADVLLTALLAWAAGEVRAAALARLYGPVSPARPDGYR